jgi:hypothetical protein
MSSCAKAVWFGLIIPVTVQKLLRCLGLCAVSRTRGADFRCDWYLDGQPKPESSTWNIAANAVAFASIRRHVGISVWKVTMALSVKHDTRPNSKDLHHDRDGSLLAAVTNVATVSVSVLYQDRSPLSRPLDVTLDKGDRWYQPQR